jgi:hypothetical protein
MPAPNGIFNKPFVGGRAIRTLRFRFFPNGTNTTAMTKAAGTLYDYGGCITDVTRSSVAGSFTVNTTFTGYRVVGGKVQVQLSAANTSLTGQLGDISNQGSVTTPLSFVVRLLAGATATDMSSNTNNSVLVDLDIEEYNPVA